MENTGNEISTVTLNGNKYSIADKHSRDKLGDIETALDSIIAIQNELIGGDEA